MLVFHHLRDQNTLYHYLLTFILKFHLLCRANSRTKAVLSTYLVLLSEKHQNGRLTTHEQDKKLHDYCTSMLSTGCHIGMGELEEEVASLLYVDC
jgi:hypothetical protein